MFVEIEQQEKVIEELIKGLAQKNPKVVAGCVTNLKNCLHSFGAKVIKVSPLLKAVVPLLDHRDKVVREEGKQLIIESYRYARITNTKENWGNATSEWYIAILFDILRIIGP